MAHRPAQAHPIRHMIRAGVADQRLSGFVLQLFKIGGADLEMVLTGLRHQPPGLIADQLEHHVLHVYPHQS